MLTVNFFVIDENICGFEIKGHAGLSVSGKDILCSAVSSSSYMTVNTLTDIIGEDVTCSVSENGYMKLMCNKPIIAQSSQDLLKGFELHIKALAEDYPKNLKVIYGGVK